MCCDKATDNRKNHLQKPTLRAVCNDNLLTFEKILEKYNFVTIHVRNLRILVRAVKNKRKPICSNNV